MTKRLFAYFGLTMLGVYTVVFYFGFYGLCAAGAVFAALILYAFIAKKPFTEKPVLILVAATIVLSSVVFTVYDNSFKSLSEEYSEQTVSVIAKVKTDGAKRYGMYNYELQAEKIDSDSVNFKMILYSNFKLSCGYGDTIKVNAKLTACEENYFKSRSFVYAVESNDFKLDYKVIKHGQKGICYLPVYLQNKFSEAVKTVIKGQNGELCSTMTFGNREQLSGDINSMFSKTGLSYLIVISGFHMSVIALFLTWLLKPLGKRRVSNIIRCVIVVVFILLYMCITGLTASVVRSGTAVIATVISVTFHRRGDAYNSLGIAALFLVICNPYAVGDIGMLLSFSSVIGIIYFYPRLCRRFNSYYFERKNEFLNEINRTNQRKRELRYKIRILGSAAVNTGIRALCVSLSAIITSMPIVSLSMGYVNPTVLFSSMLLTPLTCCVVIFTLITALLFYVPVLGFVSYFTGSIADVCAGVMIYIVRVLKSASYLTLYLDRSTVWMWLALLAVLIGMAMLLKRGKKSVLAAVLFSLVFLFGSYAAKYFVHTNTVTMRIIGTGYPNVQITGGGVEALLSYGGDYDKYSALSRKLRTSCSDVKTLIVPDTKLKTARFAVNVMDEFDVKRVMLYHNKGTPLDLEQEAMSIKEYEEFYSADTVVLDLGQGVKDILYNDGKSTWQRVESAKVSVLIVPDKADAINLDEKYRSADIIVRGTDIKNIDLLDCKSDCWITAHDLKEDYNIRLK